MKYKSRNLDTIINKNNLIALTSDELVDIEGGSEFSELLVYKFGQARGYAYRIGKSYMEHFHHGAEIAL